MNIQRKSYIYRFLDSRLNILYVGKTVNLDRRIKQHFGSRGHKKGSGLYEQVYKIEYIKCESEYISLQKELYYINLYKPKFNKESKTKELIRPLKSEKWLLYKEIKKIAKKDIQNKKILNYALPLVVYGFFVYMLIHSFSKIL